LAAPENYVTHDVPKRILSTGPVQIPSTYVNPLPKTNEFITNVGPKMYHITQ